MKPVSEFYNNLPKKQCAHCGTLMDEQAESYTTACPECEEKETSPV
ncbi:protein YhfH [Aneurinibacillus terranovensis]